MKTVKAVEADKPPSTRARKEQRAAVEFHPVIIARAAVNGAGTSARQRARFVISPRSAEFQRRYFPQATSDDWNDWRWQNRNRIRTLAELERMLLLTDDEAGAIRRHSGALPVGITPYYA